MQAKRAHCRVKLKNGFILIIYRIVALLDRELRALDKRGGDTVVDHINYTADCTAAVK